MDIKHCNKCDLDKSIDDFGSHKRNKDGKQLWCKSCTTSYYNGWRVAHRGKAKPLEERSFKRFYSTIHGRAIHMNNNARARAKRNKIEYTLDAIWIENKLIEGICEITGIPFILRENNGKGHRQNSFSPSIDRIHQTGPYSQENCQMTCWIYNRAKGAFPLEDLSKMMEAISNKSSDQLNV